MESLELCTHWVMESFVAIHYTAKAFYVLGFSIWGLGVLFLGAISPISVICGK